MNNRKQSRSLRPVKILVVGKTGKLISNPFIDTLVQGITLNSHRYHIDIGITQFWECRNDYRIIHFHWPEFLFYWREPSENELHKLADTLKKWKETARVLYTRHNECPHYAESTMNRRLYQIIEANADRIVHLGRFSETQFLKERTSLKQLHCIIPHHIYDTIYTNNIEKTKARKALGISSRKTVILSFGAFRHEEEQRMVEDAFRHLDVLGKFLLAPSWYKTLAKDHAIEKNDHHFLGDGIVDRNMLPYCFTAADVVFIQRIRILNSGILPMAFLFNKTVMGPGIGNVGELLDNERNFSFDPSDRNSVLGTLKKAVNYSLTKTPTNEQYAKENWNTAKICKLYEQSYHILTDL